MGCAGASSQQHITLVEYSKDLNFDSLLSWPNNQIECWFSTIKDEKNKTSLSNCTPPFGDTIILQLNGSDVSIRHLILKPPSPLSELFQGFTDPESYKDYVKMAVYIENKALIFFEFPSGRMVLLLEIGENSELLVRMPYQIYD